MNKYKIITAANDDYILTLLNFLNHHTSIGIFFEDIVIYDLGLNNDNLQKINMVSSNRCEIKKLNYDEYSEYVNLTKYNGLNCSYAFKPIIIYREANLNKTVPLIWLDSACNLNMESFQNIYNTIMKEGFYCPIGNSEKTIESIELNHPQTVKLIGLTKEEHLNSLQSRLACMCGVLYSNTNGFHILNEWHRYSLIKDVIFPDGSSRNNHRQDQSVLSCLMYLYEKNNKIIFEKSTFGASCWNKKDKNNIEKSYKKYVLVQKYNNQILAAIYTNSIEEAVKIYYDRKKYVFDETYTLEHFLQGYSVFEM